MPTSFVGHFGGPKFGVAGTRKLAGVEGRPLIGTIIKPSVGLSPQQTAGIVKTLAEAGIDFVKDDELMANPPHSPFDDRLEAVMRVINDHAQRTGKKVMYAFNITDDLDLMQRNYEKIVNAGGSCAMISLNSTGMAATRKIAGNDAQVIHGHRNGFGMMNRHPQLGIEFPAYQTLWRLAGVDHLHVNGIKNKFWEDDDSVVRSIQACLHPLHDSATLMPVISSGQWGGQACETYRRTQAADLLYLADDGSPLSRRRRDHGAPGRPSCRIAFAPKMVGSSRRRPYARPSNGQVSRAAKISGEIWWQITAIREPSLPHINFHHVTLSAVSTCIGNRIPSLQAAIGK